MCACAAGVPVVFGVLTCDTMEQVRAQKLIVAQWLTGAACMLGLGQSLLLLHGSEQQGTCWVQSPQQASHPGVPRSM